MKKEYEKPIIEIVKIDVEDIITASGNKQFGEDPDKEGNWSDLL